jgi:hypothetical protein
MNTIPASSRRNINGVSIFISAFVLAICLLIALYAAYFSPYYGINLNGEWIVQGLPDCNPQDAYCNADRNLMELGDQIVAIDGRAPGDYLQNPADVPFQGLQPGDTIPIALVRNGRKLIVDWRIPPVRRPN